MNLTITITQPGRKPKIITTKLEETYETLDEFSKMCRRLYDVEQLFDSFKGSDLHIRFSFKSPSNNSLVLPNILTK
jgi:hypothetical protein